MKPEFWLPNHPLNAQPTSKDSRDNVKKHAVSNAVASDTKVLNTINKIETKGRTRGKRKRVCFIYHSKCRRYTFFQKCGGKSITISTDWIVSVYS